MAKEELGNSELNIDNFFGPDAGFVAEQPDDKDESPENESGEADELDTSEGKADESLDDKELDDDEEGEDEEDEDDSDDSDDADAEELSKKEKNAEMQRREIQSKYDSLLANYNKEISSLKGEIDEIKTKAKQGDIDDLFTGDDDNVMTEGQVKQLIAKSQSAAQTPSVGTDAEAQQMWANTQPDVGEVTEYFNKNNLTNDPELIVMRTVEGRYENIRKKMLRDEVAKKESENKKLKKLIKKMKKGPIPNKTGAGSRGKAQGQSDSSNGDPLDKFFSSY